jgi:hypothetical protein
MPRIFLLSSSEAGQLVQSLVSVYQKAGTIPISSVEDESAIYVSRLTANLVNVKNRSWLVVRSASEDSGDDADLNDDEECEDLYSRPFSRLQCQDSAQRRHSNLSTSTLR